MKRILCALMLVFLLLAAACSSQNTAIPAAHVEQTDLPQATQTPYKDSYDIPASPSKSYYGSWVAVSVLGSAPVSALSADQSEQLLNQSITYQKDTCSLAYIAKPVYQETVMQRSDFEEAYRITFEDMGISEEEVLMVSIQDSAAFGNCFLMASSGEMILYYEGVFFKAEPA